MSVLKKYNAASGLWQAVGGMGLPQTPVSFSAHKNGVTQTGLGTAWTATKVTFGTLAHSTGNCYDTVNSKFIAPISGLYHFNVVCRTSGVTTDKAIFASLRVNGVFAKAGRIMPGVTAVNVAPDISTDLKLAVGDYVEVYVATEDTVSRELNGTIGYTYFEGFLIPDGYDSTKQIIDLSAATSNYLLGVGETAKLVYSGVTSLSLRVATVEGVYELSIDQPYVTTNSVEGGVSLQPNETAYANSFVFSESRTDNAVNVADGAASWSGWHNGATSGTFAIGYVYIMTGKYRISTITNSKSITGQCVRLGGTTAPLSMQNEVFAGIWKDTTTVWSSLGKITFPFAQSGTILIKRIA